MPDLEKLVRIEQSKISQAKVRIGKVQEGWEKGLYVPDEALTKVAVHRETIAKAESEIKRPQEQIANVDLSAIEVELLQAQLRDLRDQNLLEATLKEKADLVAKMGAKILPAEDLKSRRIFCRLNLTRMNEEREQRGFTKVTFGGAKQLSLTPQHPKSLFRSGRNPRSIVLGH